MNHESGTQPQDHAASAAQSQAVEDLFISSDFPGASAIGRRLRLDMDRLLRKGHATWTLDSSADNGEARQSAELSGDA